MPWRLVKIPPFVAGWFIQEQQSMTGVSIFKEIREELERHNISKVDVLDALESLPKSSVLLIGDLIIDLYTFCTAIGKTAKTPTLSVKRGHTDTYWGGAALFAKNFLGLGAKVNFITVCGNDWVYEYMRKEQIRDLRLHLFIDDQRPTTLKERFWVDGYKLLQVDTINNDDIGEPIQKQLESKLGALIESCDLVLVSDSRHGIMAPELITFTKDLCIRKKKPLIVDTQVSSRSGNLEAYVGVDMICANENEARYFLRDERSDTRVILDKLYEQLGVSRLFLKLGLEGLMGYEKNKAFFRLPAIPVEVKDPIGSGDAFLSAAALTYRPEVKLMASAFVATCAGSLAVTKMGTVPNNFEELSNFVQEKLNEVFK